MGENRICSIYVLTNIVNGKVYIGQTWNLASDRMGKDGYGYKNSPYIFNAIQKYGTDKFEYEVLAQCCDQESADYLEDYFVVQYNSRNNKIGYNIKKGGSAGKHSEETKAKISESMKNKVWSPEVLANRDRALRLRKGEKRPPKSPEVIENHVAVMIKWHAEHEHPMTGRHHTEEAKIKISEANKGKIISDEHRKKMSESRKMDPDRERDIIEAYKRGDTIESIEEQFNTRRSSIYRVIDRNGIPCERDRKIWLGKKHSEETKEKMSLAKKQYWKNRADEE